MIAQSIDQATVAGGHRPMSLLLQALKQIESKGPSEKPNATSTADVDASPCETDRTPRLEAAAPSVPEAAPAIGSSAFIAPSPFIAETTAPPCEISIDVVRQYDDGETESEVALADPCELPRIPLALPQDVPATTKAAPHRDTYRFGEEVLGLLPDDSRMVMAIVSFDGANAESAAQEICAGLAAADKGPVLAIVAEATAPLSQDVTDVTFADVASGLAQWQEAVVCHPHSSFSSLPRGDLRAFQVTSRRRLLTIWQELGERFAYVVLELTVAELDQTLPILATCDAAFLTLRLNETKRADVERFAARVRSSGCHLCGCLVR